MESSDAFAIRARSSTAWLMPLSILSALSENLPAEAALLVAAAAWVLAAIINWSVWCRLLTGGLHLLELSLHYRELSVVNAECNNAYDCKRAINYEAAKLNERSQVAFPARNGLI